MLLYSAQTAAIRDRHWNFRAFSRLVPNPKMDGAVTSGAGCASAQDGAVLG